MTHGNTYLTSLSGLQMVLNSLVHFRETQRERHPFRRSCVSFVNLRVSFSVFWPPNESATVLEMVGALTWEELVMSHSNASYMLSPSLAFPDGHVESRPLCFMDETIPLQGTSECSNFYVFGCLPQE